MKKKILLALSSLVVLLLGGGFAGQAWLKGRLQKESLVAQMEAAWSCRAHLDDTSVSLFSTPATVKLIGLKLASRDAEVDKPLAERAALAPDSVVLSAKEAVLSVELTDLLHGTLNVERLQLDDLNVRNVVDAEGHGSLDAIFHKRRAEETPGEIHASTPVSVTGKGGNATPAETQDAPSQTDAIHPPKEPKPAHRPITANQMYVNLAVKTAGVSNGRFESTDLKSGTKATIENLGVELTDVDVVPGDLANHNLCKFSLSASVKVEKSDPAARFADFALSGSGTVAPFDSKAGEWNPDIDLNLTMKQGGLLGGMPLSQQKGKEFDRLKEYGIQLGDVAIGGLLQKDATTRVHLLPGGKIIVKQDTTFGFSDYEMTLAEKSWFNPTQDQHSARATLTISPALSARMLGDSKKLVSEKYGETIGEVLVAAVKVALMDDQQRIVLPFKAKGSMSKPDVTLDNILGDITELLKKAGKGFFDQFFKESPKEPAKELPNESPPPPN